MAIQESPSAASEAARPRPADLARGTNQSGVRLYNERLVLSLIRRVRDKGLPVILISHNMPHVFEIADRIHIARLGKRACIVNPKTISMSDTVAVMTGAKRADELPAECLA